MRSCEMVYRRVRQVRKKVDLAKGCLPFKKREDLALEVVAALIKKVTWQDYVNWMEQVFPKLSS